MRKKLILLLLFVVLTLGGVVFWVYHIICTNYNSDDNSSDWKEGWDIVEYSAYVLREKHPTDIIWYGKWEDYQYEVPVRVETEVSDTILKPREGYQNVYIVIDDTDDNCELVEEDYKKIIQYVQNDGRYHFIYAGNQMELIIKCGLGRIESIEEDDFSIAAYHYPGADHPTACYGVWKRSDVETEEEKKDTSYVHYSFADNAFTSLVDHMPNN